MADIRKIIIIFVVAILFATFVFSAIEAVYPQPKWEDFCQHNGYYAEPYPAKIIDGSNCTRLAVPKEEYNRCNEKKGQIEYDYDSLGCATDYNCNTCNYQFTKAQEQYKRYVFYISAFLALLAIFVGLYLPAQKNPLHEWIGTGFLLGGAFALFFGTALSFTSLDRYIRPVIILLELLLVIFLAYKKVKNLRNDSK